MSATFGLFSPGNYILDFQDGEYGYPAFMIGERNTFDDIIVLHQEQSECYGMSILVNNTVPNKFKLHRPYPNPFNPSSSISYDIQTTAHVSLTIYNLLGENVVELINEIKSPGNYHHSWNGTNAYGYSVAGGIYFITLSTDEYVSTRKLVLLK